MAGLRENRAEERAWSLLLSAFEQQHMFLRHRHTVIRYMLAVGMQEKDQMMDSEVW